MQILLHEHLSLDAKDNSILFGIEDVANLHAGKPVLAPNATWPPNLFGLGPTQGLRNSYRIGLYWLLDLAVSFPWPQLEYLDLAQLKYHCPKNVHGPIVTIVSITLLEGRFFAAGKSLDICIEPEPASPSPSLSLTPLPNAEGVVIGSTIPPAC